MYIAIHECIISMILHIFKMSYQLWNIEQCYLPWPNVICLGKWQITCTAIKNRSLLLPALFLYSSSHNWIRKFLGFLPFISTMLYIYYHWQGTKYNNVWMSVISIFYIHHFSLNRTDVSHVTAKQRCVTHNQRQDGARKMSVLFWGDMPKVNNNISNCPEICIVLCKMSSMLCVN